MDRPTSARTPDRSDVSDAEGAVVAPYLTLMEADAPHRAHDLREACNGRRYIVRGGRHWRLMPNDLPPGDIVVSQQTRRWRAAGCFAAIVHDLRALRRRAAGRDPEPTAASRDSRTLPSTPASGGRSGYDGAQRRTGAKTPVAVATLGHLLARHVTPADDQGDTGAAAAAAAVAHGIRLEVVKHPAARRGLVLLPRRWVAARSFAGMARFRRLARAYERLAPTLEGVHSGAFALVALAKARPVVAVLGAPPSHRSPHNNRNHVHTRL